MTGVAFILFTNYMVPDPGTTPTKPLPQFMFGGGVAFVYAILMVANAVFVLFFAVVIVCAVRGGGWWAVHFYNKYRAQQQARRESETLAALDAETAKVAV